MGIAGETWREAAVQVSWDLGVSILPVTVGLGQSNDDLLGQWARMRDTSNEGCLLIRPDRVVAWRNPGHVTDPTSELATAVKQILGR